MCRAGAEIRRGVGLLWSCQTTGRDLFWLTVVLLAGLSGCGARYHIEQLTDQKMLQCCDKRRIQHARALESYPDSSQATIALIKGLKDPDPAVRYVSAEALQAHLLYAPSPQLRRKVYEGLTDALDDTSFGEVCTFLPLLPIGVSGHTGSVRSRALLTLTDVTRVDFGFDKAKWEQYFADLAAQ